MAKLEILREQLKTAIEFMSDTPTDHFGWMGEMPAVPELYEPEDWVKGQNRSIGVIWGDFLYGLTKYGLHDRRQQAEELEIADLLVDPLAD